MTNPRTWARTGPLEASQRPAKTAGSDLIDLPDGAATDDAAHDVVVDLVTARTLLSWARQRSIDLPPQRLTELGIPTPAQLRNRQPRSSQAPLPG